MDQLRISTMANSITIFYHGNGRSLHPEASRNSLFPFSKPAMIHPFIKKKKKKNSIFNGMNSFSQLMK